MKRELGPPAAEDWRAVPSTPPGQREPVGGEVAVTLPKPQRAGQMIFSQRRMFK